MNQPTSIPSFSEISTILKAAESPFGASQIHGLLCGLVCVYTDQMDDNWQKIIIGDQSNKQYFDLLQRLYEANLHEISEFSFEFTLMLPKDSADINLRTEALGLWCQGFLTGLQQSENIIKERTSEEVKEALNDIIEIAQVNFGDIKSDDEDETAYYELVEYVRLIVLMIYHELNAISPPDNSDFSNSLH